MATYLEFERTIQQIDEEIASARIKGDAHAVEILQKKFRKRGC